LGDLGPPDCRGSVAPAEGLAAGITAAILCGPSARDL
jgi:hypothetical protein